MSVSSVSSGLSQMAMAAHGQITRPDAAAVGSGESGLRFGERMGEALRDVARTQESASQAARDFELGAREDLAAVMVEQQLSSLSFQMTLQVRNKALGAYRDIMNMPV